MRAVLPGKPAAKLQAISTALWDSKQIIAYVSGYALIILGGPHDVLQTIYHEEEEELIAVTIDEVSGRIAVCTHKVVHIYKPYGQREDALKWSLQCTVEPDPNLAPLSTLSWGIEEEILVGASSLILYSTNNGTEQIWRKPLANPVKFAQFSYDASLIASTGFRDRLVKLWRRLSFGTSDVRFDYAYLAHPTSVTGIHWRKPLHKEQQIEHVLFTLCADSKLRVWTAMDPHGLQILQLWAEINLVDSIQPRSISLAEQSKKRFAFILDSKDLRLATERAVEHASEEEKEQYAIGHLTDVANMCPEVCVVLDDRGHMSAWGLENVGCKTRKTTDVFNIVHSDGVRLHLGFNNGNSADNVQLYPVCGEGKGSGFSLLVHHFDGRIDWLEGGIDKLFDPSPQKNRLHVESTWTGHSGAIKKVNRTVSGQALVSRTEHGETIVWVQKASASSTTLHRQSIIDISEHIHRTCVLQEGSFVILLHHDKISLWDTRERTAIKVADCPYTVRGKPLCLILLPELETEKSIAHVATVSSEMKGIVWEVIMPSESSSKGQRRQSQAISLKQFCTVDLGSGDDLAFVLPVDPAGSTPVISGFLDTFARDVAISYTRSGVVKSWTAKVDRRRRKIDWLQTSSVETGIQDPSLASGSSIRKAAIVDSEKTTLTIWDTRSQQLEYKEHFEGSGPIQDLDWATTPDSQSILSVGFPHSVIIYCQLRYDYLEAGPSWASIREIRLRDLTPHPIGDSVWLGSGNLVIGAGNQLFIHDKHVTLSESLVPDLRLTAHERKLQDMFTVVSRLNGPLPAYHPQFVSQCLLAGKISQMQAIIIELLQKLKFFTEGDHLDPLLDQPAQFFVEENMEHYIAPVKNRRTSYIDFTEDEKPSAVTEEVAAALNEKLTETKVPLLSSQEQFRLADIIECMGTVEKHRRSIDDNAARFLLFFRQHVILSSSKHLDESSSISWREITWAYHSGSQDILVDLVNRHFNSRMLWKHAKESGMFMWMSDINALKAQFEVIARNEYTKTDEKNPVDCSLYYLALRKKAVLVGLWRMATWSREQGATQRLLANNFQEQRWKVAAQKNAYALMGKRRFEYAASFFLLADSLKDAVSVLANQMGDIQLAIAVARVYEGDNGPVLRSFLVEKVLPLAAEEGNRWQATWAFWMLQQRDRAVRALVSPIHTLLSPPGSPAGNLQAKSFLTDDPALVVLYKLLREKSLQTLKGAAMVPPREEWDFVTHTARLYGRMGCDLLALDLVRNWEFLPPPPTSTSTSTVLPTSPASLDGTSTTTSTTTAKVTSPVRTRPPPSALNGNFDIKDIDPRKMLRRRSSLVVADLPSPIRAGFASAEQKEAVVEEERQQKQVKQAAAPPPTPKTFQEPDANSLLDSFGF
ncbi:WD repeat protein-like protein [Viridothelium virens]|uniref:WD repeat protein-like protein n=1 Tax=Viridothelium virens TaxID=1048519 RepID=A0A6A6GVU3_VIRVR|nr:WD repeat protein-like protein [Viridothelium virens]